MTTMALNRAPGPDAGLLGLKLVSQLKANPLAFFVNLAREYGDFARFRVGPQQAFFVNKPEHLQRILVDEARKFYKAKRSKAILGRFIGQGILLSDGDFWLRQRRLVQPAFHSSRIEAYADTMVDHTLRAVSGWEDGSVHDLAPEMRALALSIVGKTLFDADTADVAQKVDTALTIVQEYATEASTSAIILPDWLPTARNRRWRRAIGELDMVINRIIDERRTTGEDKGDLLSMLLLASDEETGAKMTKQQARDELMTLFLAGHDTTANALAWLWYILSSHPEVEEKLWHELDTVLQGRPPKLADLPKLAYTDMVFKEVLRLFPPAWSFIREPIEDVVFDGCIIPKGAAILIVPFVLHRDPRYFPEPEKFMPERFADGFEKRIPRTAYIPFSTGPRVCIGNTFATMEGRLALATIAQRYKLRLVPGTRVEYQPEITLRPGNTVPMIVERRRRD